MKCPLLMLAQRVHDGSHTIPLTDCIQGECAWWMVSEGRCAYRSSAESLCRILRHALAQLEAAKGKCKCDTWMLTKGLADINQKLPR